MSIKKSHFDLAEIEKSTIDHYENNAELIGWDGILEGRKAENGNYLMVVKGVTIYQENINRQGVFTLLR